METIRVAAVQVESVNGAMAQNLANAEPYVAEAAEQGARLILCPEFLAAGYVYEETIWEAGEPQGGATETWLADMAARHRVTIGATFLEADGEHFHNTFSLFGPGGELLGRVRKQSLPWFEGWFFRPCSRPKVIETELGPICVGICNDNQTADFFRQALDCQPRLILMPHSAPTPQLPSLAGKLFQSHFESQLADVAEKYARALGVPVVMANKVSDTPFTTSLPVAPRLRVKLLFRGHSSICDGNGRTLASLVGREGALVADVHVGGEVKQPARPRGYWSFAPKYLGRAMAGLLTALDRAGQRAYRNNPRRARAAHRAATASSAETTEAQPA